MRQHLLTAQSRTGHGGCSGLTGFEPAMCGEREYGFAGVGVSAADGDSRFLAPDTDRLRLPPDQLGAALRRRLLAWGILHRYSRLTWRMRRGERRRAVVIYGPTSSSKTALSLDVCEAASGRGLRPVVLNADSRQVYTGMDIGTSKIKPSRMRGFEHRLLDVAEPSSKLSLEAYAQMARDELA